MLTPLDIENKRFQRGIRGYDVDEVDDFLDQLTDDYETLYKENSMLKQKIEEVQNDLEHYKSLEQTLQSTLVMAQTTAEDIKLNAQTSADDVRKNAQDRAEQIIRDAQSEARKATDEIAKEEFEIRKRTEELKRQFGVYRAKMESLLISQLELLQNNKDDEE